MKQIRCLIIFLACVSLTTVTAGCTGKKGEKDETGEKESVLLNQIGYSPSSSKIALIRCNATLFEVINSLTGEKVFSSTAGEPRYWEFSGDTVRQADFSALTEPGKYRIFLPERNITSWEFTIGEGIYSDIAKATVKAFFFNRSGFEITEPYGGRWARKAGHPDTAVLVHESAASKSRPAGTVISGPGGWYDAGDYNKYIVNSSITCQTLMLFYDLYPDYCRATSLGIPESGNEIPDLVDELLYNLRWMLTMQDVADGGVYHKLTNKRFNAFEMPEVSGEPRYVVQKSTAATLDFASVTAFASRLFANDQSEELRKLSQQCGAASAMAMKWAEANPSVIYRQPADISTGEYGDSDLSDEWFWARCETALLKNDPSAAPAIDTTATNPDQLSWNKVQMLGLFSLALNDQPSLSSLKEQAVKVLTSYANTMVAKSDASPYRVSIDYFEWGSNSDVANQAMLKLIVLDLTNDAKYLRSAEGDLDYLLGRNATGYCTVTGFGSLSPMHIHHRPSGADGVPEPVPGFLVGGPNISVMNDCGPTVIRSKFPAKSYTDSECSYSTNEICINWNAPVVFIINALNSRTKDTSLSHTEPGSYKE